MGSTISHTLRTPEERAVATILGLVEEEKYQEAIAMAKNSQKDHCYNALWRLAEYFFDKIDDELIPIQQLFDLYKNISQESPYYSKSRDKALHIVMLITPQMVDSASGILN